MSLTNRDIYVRVSSFEDKYGGSSLPSLEAYLRSLWLVVSKQRPDTPTAQQVADWLEQAFNTMPPAFDPRWLQLIPKYDFENAGYDDWEGVIQFQIADLRRMAESGILEDKYRYFGVDSPSGSRWYNFDPLIYLECGIRGTLGGYQETEVIVLIAPSDGQSADSPVYEINELNWEEFIGILECGRVYE
jgi:hypothetical protein